MGEGGGGGVSAILGNGYEIQGQNCIALQGCREGYCEYGSATRTLRWVYDVLGESNLTRLSGLMGSKADSRIGDALSFPRRVDVSILSCDDVLNKNLVFFHKSPKKKLPLTSQDCTISFTWENSKMFNITSKYFSIFNNKPPAS